jgi:hypothetical protein
LPVCLLLHGTNTVSQEEKIWTLFNYSCARFHIVFSKAKPSKAKPNHTKPKQNHLLDICSNILEYVEMYYYSILY